MKGEQLYLFGFPRDQKKVQRRFKIILPLDTLMLLSAALIIVFAVSFSLGVRKGKRIALAGLNQPVSVSPAEDDTAENPAPKITPDQKEKTLPSQISDGQQSPKEKIKRYHIQVASFRKENTAQRAARNLEDTGYPAFVLQKGEYMVVYVGEFSNKDEAKSKLQSLQKKYKDCILRRL